MIAFEKLFEPTTREMVLRRVQLPLAKGGPMQIYLKSLTGKKITLHVSD